MCIRDRNGNAHGEFDIVGGPQNIRQGKGRRPQEDGTAVMNQHEYCRQFQGFFRKAVQLHGERHGDNHPQTAEPADEIRKLHHFLCVIFRLFKIACAHTCLLYTSKQLQKLHRL